MPLLLQDTEDIHFLMELINCWKEQLIAQVSRLKEIEDALCAQIIATQQGIANWFSILNQENK